MWKDKYWNNDGALYRDLSREDDGTPIEEIGRYEIVFDFKEQRYYCFVDAISMDEALEIFFVNHDTVTYKDVIDHMEI
jgi:hypothetical protein